MTTNTNGDGSLTPESSSDARIQDSQDDDWEGLKRAHNKETSPNKSGKFSWDEISFGLGTLLFIACWIVLGVIIFHYLTGMGIVVVLAVLGGIIGGFIAAVITWIVGMAGGF